MGDMGYEIPVFPFFPLRLRFYYGDEEFPAQLSVLFDENTLQYMHYETTYYVVNCLMGRVHEKILKKQGILIISQLAFAEKVCYNLLAVGLQNSESGNRTRQIFQ